MSFGQLLKEARKKQEKTLKEVSQAAGLSLSYISDMEQERRKAPSLDVVKKIELFLGLANGVLVNAAQAEMNIQSEVRTIFRKRPELNMQLLRAADYCSEEELTEMINDMLKRKGHPNDVP
ncbi:MAG: helix-turn-helix transcriptional regulator [Desulfuromonadales bacterium]|nr:helix-turn-helix transcriptional regulator [Desulfuromonadales bacterium]